MKARRQAVTCGHRVLFVLTDTDDHTARAVMDWYAPGGELQYGTIVPDAGDRRDRQDRIDALLGDETDVVCFDARVAFDPGLFAAAAGTLRAGGLLLLLGTPSVTGDGTGGAAFARRFVGFLHRDCVPVEGHSHWLLLSALPTALPPEVALREVSLREEPLPAAPLPATSRANEQQALAEQDRLLDAALHHTLSHPRAVVTLQAHRGHGKSALLGRLYRVLEKAGQRPRVSAVRRGAIRVLERHAGGDVRFDPVARLLEASRQHPEQTIPDNDVLLLDEAATLPLSTLQQLLACTPRVILATTVHGYEGAGRGFALRLDALLSRLSSEVLHLAPTHPFRWAADDPLAAFVNAVCLLDAEPADIAPEPGTEASPVAVDRLPEDRTLVAGDWLDEEQLLRQTFGLLLQAHYQTTPTDLQHLLDRPDLATRIALYDGQVIAAVLYTLEGPLDAALHDDVRRRRRRPHNQLLPQQLAQSLDTTWPLTRRFCRVIRVAVLPALQRKGIGSALLDRLAAALPADIDAIGASFGADHGTLTFWQRAGYTPVHTGLRVNPRSGQRAVAVLAARPHAALMIAHVQAAATLHCDNLAARTVMGQGPFVGIDVDGRVAGIDTEERAHGPIPTSTLPMVRDLIPADRDQLQQFSRGERSLVDSAAAIGRFAVACGVAHSADRWFDALCAQLEVAITGIDGHTRSLERRLRSWLRDRLAE